MNYELACSLAAGWGFRYKFAISHVRRHPFILDAFVCPASWNAERVALARVSNPGDGLELPAFHRGG